MQTLEKGEEASEESSEEELEEEVQCVDLEPVANIDELFDDFKGHLFFIVCLFCRHLNIKFGISLDLKHINVS